MTSYRSQAEPALSLEAFLDIITNVVGVLILIALVTVMSAGQLAITSAPTARRPIAPSSERLLFECAGDRLYFVDEAAIRNQVTQLVQQSDDELVAPKAIMEFLDDSDVGNASYSVRAEPMTETGGVAWVYRLREGAPGERIDHLDQPGSRFQRQLARLSAGGGFVYFVVHDDAFETFRRARDLCRARGIPSGWYPVERQMPLRLSVHGQLGRQIQ